MRARLLADQVLVDRLPLYRGKRAPLGAAWPPATWRQLTLHAPAPSPTPTRAQSTNIAAPAYEEALQFVSNWVSAPPCVAQLTAAAVATVDELNRAWGVEHSEACAFKDFNGQPLAL